MVFVALHLASGEETTINTDQIKQLAIFDYPSVEEDYIAFAVRKLDDPRVGCSPFQGKSEEEIREIAKNDQKDILDDLSNAKTTIIFMDGSREFIKETQVETREKINKILVFPSKSSEPSTPSKKGDLGKSFS